MTILIQFFLCRYTSNAEETDTRMWLHAKKAPFRNILIISPDTDSYHIGMPLVFMPEKDIIVQLNKMSSKDLQFFYLTSFIKAINNDPDLSAISNDILPQIFQTLYVGTGCDFTSFFSKTGKAIFYRHFFQNADFITSGKNEASGTLADIGLADGIFEYGFLSFLRLVGVTYFKKNNSGFVQPTPHAHFKSIANPNHAPLEQHKAWIENIRLTISDRCPFENLMIPSVEALYRHWKRTCWVIDMWGQSDKNYMQLRDIGTCGWRVVNNTLTVEWDSEENISAVETRVASLLKGCKCKSGCHTKRCGCKGKGKECYIGCECINCSNLPQQVTTESSAVPLHDMEDTSSSDDDTDVDELMDWVFNE